MLILQRKELLHVRTTWLAKGLQSRTKLFNFTISSILKVLWVWIILYCLCKLPLNFAMFLFDKLDVINMLRLKRPFSWPIPLL